MNIKLSTSGVMRKSLIHYDHVLIVDIDNDGVVRKSFTVPLEHDPMISLIDDVAQGFHYINGEPGKPIVIDCYTSNQQLVKFIQNIMTKTFEHATTNRIDDKFKFTISTFGHRTILYSTRINFAVSPYAEPDFGDLEDSVKGIILDTDEIEKKELDVEEILRPYSWVVIILPLAKKEGYFNIFSPYLIENKIPFFLDSLSNQTLKNMFDFIFATTLEN